MLQVVGPGFNLAGGGQAIADLVFGGGGGAEKSSFLSDTVAKMKAGGAGTTTYQNDGDHYVAYAPVKVTTLQPLDPSEFGSGVSSKSTLVYSLGVSISNDDLIKPFTLIADEINDQINGAVAGMIVLIIIACVLGQY